MTNTQIIRQYNTLGLRDSINFMMEILGTNDNNALGWVLYGFDPVLAREWIKAGVTNSNDANDLRNLAVAPSQALQTGLITTYIQGDITALDVRHTVDKL